MALATLKQAPKMARARAHPLRKDRGILTGLPYPVWSSTAEVRSCPHTRATKKRANPRYIVQKTEQKT